MLITEWQVSKKKTILTADKINGLKPELQKLLDATGLSGSVKARIIQTKPNERTTRIVDSSKHNHVCLIIKAPGKGGNCYLIAITLSNKEVHYRAADGATITTHPGGGQTKINCAVLRQKLREVIGSQQDVEKETESTEDEILQNARFCAYFKDFEANEPVDQTSNGLQYRTPVRLSEEDQRQFVSLLFKQGVLLDNPETDRDGYIIWMFDRQKFIEFMVGMRLTLKLENPKKVIPAETTDEVVCVPEIASEANIGEEQVNAPVPEETAELEDESLPDDYEGLEAYVRNLEKEIAVCDQNAKTTSSALSDLILKGEKTTDKLAELQARKVVVEKNIAKLALELATQQKIAGELDNTQDVLEDLVEKSAWQAFLAVYAKAGIQPRLSKAAE